MAKQSVQMDMMGLDPGLKTPCILLQGLILDFSVVWLDMKGSTHELPTLGFKVLILTLAWTQLKILGKI